MKASSITRISLTFALLTAPIAGWAFQDQAPAQTPSETTAITVDTQTSAVPAKATTTPGDSHVRIVRLSEVHGEVTMDRGAGKGYEATMQNMPIVEGAKLMADDGYAEIEFEDGSTMRLTPDSRVEFPQLVLHSTGAKASTVNVMRGTVYVNLENSKDNEFTLKAGQATLSVPPSTHLRLEITWPKMVLSVFSGNVTVQSGGTATTIGKKEAATLDASDASKVELTKKIAEATYDGWDKQQIDYHKRYAGGKAFAGGGYGYGISDLNYYGGFINTPCGQYWQPYFASAAWDPYANGAWANYGAAGYSWVSPYPWGWLPYHTGTWMFCQGSGWGWQPGGSWMGLANGTNIAAQPLPGNGTQVSTFTGGARPVGPPRPPATARSSFVVQNRAPLVVSKESQPGNFVFQKDSAGMGVPRGSLGNLHGLSNDTVHHGFVNRSVYSEPMANTPATPDHPMHTPTALHQGSAADHNPQQQGNWNHQPGNQAGGNQQGGGHENHASGGQSGHWGGGGSSQGSGGGGGPHAGGGGGAPSSPSSAPSSASSPGLSKSH
jgi:ferric-dicitrate binding protein FerR (iron transport regulator)